MYQIYQACGKRGTRAWIAGIGATLRAPAVGTHTFAALELRQPRGPFGMVIELEALRAEVISCRKCPRLVEFRERVAHEKRAEFSTGEYWGRPVAGFGVSGARLMVVGLAPAAHGGNRTGRVFTGDRSGDFLFKCLFKAGLANQPVSTNRVDGLILWKTYVTAAVKCAPPENQPTIDEIHNCSTYLRREMELLKEVKVFLCLGHVAFRSACSQLWSIFRLRFPVPTFRHGLRFSLGENLPVLFASYHPSPRNTQTGRLTEKMFDEILSEVKSIL